MSIWSRFGLMDKEDVFALKTEIALLRKENEVFREENSRLLENMKMAYEAKLDMLMSETFYMKEQNEKRFSMNEKQFEELSSSAFEISLQLNQKIDKCIGILEQSNQSANKLADEKGDVLKMECADIKKMTKEFRIQVAETAQQNTELLITEKNIAVNKGEKHMEGIETLLNHLQKQICELNQCALQNNQLVDESDKKVDKIVDLSEKTEEKVKGMDELQEDLFALAESVKNLWSIMKAVWVDSLLEDMNSLK